MATRFYLSSTATVAGVTPVFAAWTRTSEADRLAMFHTKDASAMTSKTTFANTSPAANASALNRQYISEPMSAGIAFVTTDTITCMIRCQESAVNDNVNRAPICLKVYSQDGTTLRATLKALGAYGLNTTEWPTVLTNKEVVISTTVLDANYTTVAGDRLVLELGAQVDATGGTSVTATQSFGSASATDLAVNETGTTADNPWFECSRAITWLETKDVASAGALSTIDTKDASSAAALSTIGTKDAASAGALSAPATKDAASAAATNAPATKDATTAGALSAPATKEVASAAALATIGTKDVGSAAATSTADTKDVTTAAALNAPAVKDVASAAALSQIATKDATSGAALSTPAVKDATSAAAVNAPAHVDAASVASVSVVASKDAGTASALAAPAMKDLATAAAIAETLTAAVASAAAISDLVVLDVASSAALSTTNIRDASTEGALATTRNQDVASVSALAELATAAIGTVASINTSVGPTTLEVETAAAVGADPYVNVRTGAAISVEAAPVIILGSGGSGGGRRRRGHTWPEGMVDMRPRLRPRPEDVPLTPRRALEELRLAAALELAVELQEEEMLLLGIP